MYDQEDDIDAEYFRILLENIKDGFDFEDHVTDFIPLIRAIQKKTKDFFPMNEVPKAVIASIKDLEENIQASMIGLKMTANLIIEEVRKYEELKNEK